MVHAVDAVSIEIAGSGFVGRSLVGRLRELGIAVRLRSMRTDTIVTADGDPGRAPTAVVFAGGAATPGMGDDELPTAIARSEALLRRVSARMADHGVERLLLMSSAGPVYGASTAPVDETRPPDPTTAYGRLKVAEEVLARDLVPQGVVVTALRCTNLYGPAQEAGRQQGLIPVVLDLARRGEVVRIFGDGDQRRDYVHVDDVADVVARLLSIDPVDPEHPTGTVNVALGRQSSVVEVIDEIERVIGSSVDRVVVPAPPQLTGHQPPVDNRVLRRLMGPGWEPTTLAEGIRATASAMEAAGPEPGGPEARQ